MEIRRVPSAPSKLRSRGCNLSLHLSPLPSAVAAGCGVALAVKPPQSSIKSENYKVPCHFTRQCSDHPTARALSLVLTRAKERPVLGTMGLCFPFLSALSTLTVFCVRCPRQSG